ncbi:MAG TPA: PEP_CTERM-anchored TLD domain-containing protein [Pseudomonadales bacterium]|nr:PEP_CTERM-anchored TLD domain-containing protein [Pseudomonadales bacterium]
MTGGELLTDSGATFLENRLGLGDLDFTNISNLTVGDTAAKWHADVKGYTNVISIYDVNYQGNNYLIGGYSTIGHDGSGYSGYYSDPSLTANNFLFNLTLGLTHNTQNISGYLNQSNQFDNAEYFATFGGGHDLFGGASVLGNTGGNQAYIYSSASSYNYGYNYGGTENLLGDKAGGVQYLTINGLESYVFNPAAPTPSRVPEPAMFALLALGLAAVGVGNKRKNA